MPGPPVGSNEIGVTSGNFQSVRHTTVRTGSGPGPGSKRLLWPCTHLVPGVVTECRRAQTTKERPFTTLPTPPDVGTVCDRPRLGRDPAYVNTWGPWEGRGTYIGLSSPTHPD